MAWKLRDEDRAALLAAVQRPAVMKANPAVAPRENLIEAYATALGELRGKVEQALSMLKPLEPEPEPEADSTPELDIF